MSEQRFPPRGARSTQVGVVFPAGRRGAWTAHKSLSRRRSGIGVSRGLMSRQPGGMALAEFHSSVGVESAGLSGRGRKVGEACDP